MWIYFFEFSQDVIWDLDVELVLQNGQNVLFHWYGIRPVLSLFVKFCQILRNFLKSREGLKDKKLAHFQKERRKRQKGQYNQAFLAVTSWILRVFLLLEARVSEAVVLQPNYQNPYLKMYLKVPSYSPRLLLSGNESIAISFYCSLLRPISGTMVLTF